MAMKNLVYLFIPFVFNHMTLAQTHMKMKNSIETYTQAWNTEDATKRQALLEASFSQTGTYIDEHVPKPAHDRAAMLEIIQTFRSRLPHKMVLKGEPQLHNHVFRMRWSLINGNSKLSEGVFVGTFDENGKIASVIGFID
ncbi:MAG TPA: hypothetical protein DCS93_17225 [Microscillaceae bacterium]|nr:hypothetical protein [Microscillaceae bacterium]